MDPIFSPPELVKFDRRLKEIFRFFMQPTEAGSLELMNICVDSYSPRQAHATTTGGHALTYKNITKKLLRNSEVLSGPYLFIFARILSFLKSKLKSSLRSFRYSVPR